jgi:hypothetical protein
VSTRSILSFSYSNHYYRARRSNDPRFLSLNINYSFAAVTANPNLCVHLEKYHEEEYVKVCEENGWPMMLPKRKVREETASLLKQSTLDSSLLQDTSSTGRPIFTRAALVRALISFVVADDQSINVIECREFRDLLLLLRSDLKDKDIPHRTKLREAIIETWDCHFKALRLELADAVGKVSFTADLWSDKNLRSYICITAHWIARNKRSKQQELKTALIAFHNVTGKHDGANLAAVVLQLLDRAGITALIGWFTLDNASNNDTFVVALEALLKARDIDFCAVENRIMCFAHIINICCQHLVEGFTNTALVDPVETFVAAERPREPNAQTFEEAVKRDPIALGRVVVRKIRSSGQRREHFKSIIIEGNSKAHFTLPDGSPMTVPLLQLLRDVKTRWDSIYYMINRLRVLRPAINSFLASPVNKDLQTLRLTDVEWNTLQDIEAILAVPHAAQQTMSKETTPILSGSIPAFEMFMSSWEQLAEKIPRLKPFIDKGLQWALKYYERMDRTDAYVVAMIINPSIRTSWIKKHWGADWLDKAETSFRDLMQLYRDRVKPTAPEELSSATPAIASVEAWQTLDAQYGLGDMFETAADEPGELVTVDEEYESYVKGPLSKPGTNLLQFWTMSDSTFPTIYSIAMDYLPIQASSVPSERVFSSSAETDTHKRNRIHPLLMEALQMLKFGLKKSRLDFMTGWAVNEASMLDVEEEEVDLLGSLFEGDREMAFDALIAAMGEGDDGDNA